MVDTAEAFLTDRLKEAIWELEENQSQPGSRDGSGFVIELGRAHWLLTLRYENLSNAGYRDLTAWIARRKQARVSFTAYRSDRRYPLLNSSFSNSGLGISSVSAGASTISFTGLGSTVVSAGDMCSFFTNKSGYYIGTALHNATPSGGAATVTVHPPPLTPHGSTPDVRLKDAIGEFQMVEKPQVTEPVDGRRNVTIIAREIVRLA